MPLPVASIPARSVWRDADPPPDSSFEEFASHLTQEFALARQCPSHALLTFGFGHPRPGVHFSAACSHQRRHAIPRRVRVATQDHHLGSRLDERLDHRDHLDVQVDFKSDVAAAQRRAGKIGGHAPRERDVAVHPREFCFGRSGGRRIFDACHRGCEILEDWLCVRVAVNSSCSTR
jgi:hypothetical protein